MILRYVKISFVLFLGLWALVSLIGNFLAMAGTYRAVARVSSGAELPELVKPMTRTTSPTLNWLGVVSILIGKAVAATCLFIGLWNMWTVRAASSEIFNSAKEWALVGGWLNVLWLFIGFALFGEVVFYMFASERGAKESQTAFRYVGYFALPLLFLAQPD